MDTTEINFARLTQEINKFVGYLEPTEYEIDCRDHVVRKIQQHTRNQIPNAQVYAFGSLETKLLLPSSDVDIAVMYPNNGGTQKSILKKLRYGLGRYGIRVEYVAHNAKVPLIKCVDIRTQLGIDITVQNNTLSSTRTVRWMKEYSELKPLFLVLKHALLGIRFESDEKYRVMDTTRGGIASFVIVCLIVHYLKYNEVSKKSTDPATHLGKVLVGFLKFYSTFDFKTMGLKFDDNNKFFDLATNTKFKYDPLTARKRMVIENPDEQDQNAARACMTAMEFQAVLQWMYAQLKPLIESTKPSASILSRITTVEEHMPGEKRKTLHDYKFPVTTLSIATLREYLPLDQPSPLAKKPKKRSLSAVDFDARPFRSQKRYKENTQRGSYRRRIEPQDTRKDTHRSRK